MTLKPASLQWSDEGRLLNLDYDDIYFQPAQGMDESYYVFLEKNNLPTRFKSFDTPCFRIAELGFGSGLNFFITADLFLKTASPDQRLTFLSFEKHPIKRDDFIKIYQNRDIDKTIIDAMIQQYPPMLEGFHHLSFENGRINLILCFGDVNDLLPQTMGQFDAWYLDGFAPAKNPDMWVNELFPMIAERTAYNGTLSTFSAAGHVRRGLEDAGFTVTKEKGFGKKRDMVTAIYPHGSSVQNTHPTVTILGGGLAGCSAAYALSKRGIDTTLIERRQNVAQETSGNPAAMLYPKLAMNPAINGGIAGLYQHGFLWAKHIIETLGVTSWNPCGVLRMADNEQESDKHQSLIDTHGYPNDYARITDNGLFHETSGHVSPVELCQKLSTAHKVRKIFATEITRIKHENNQWAGYTSDGTGIFQSDILILADGINANQHDATSWMTLRPLRGQITALKPTDASRDLKHVICPSGYITPVIHDRHYTGATFQSERPDDNATEYEVRATDHMENLKRLQDRLPHLGFTEDHIINGRTGYRATTRDKIPMVGPCPKYNDYIDLCADLRTGQNVDHIEKPYHDGLYITTGFGAHGVSAAPLAGEILACMITHEPFPIPKNLLDDIVPERFILRDLKKRRI